jgi:Zn-dependent peptidase ImmA (M78 family)
MAVRRRRIKALVDALLNENTIREAPVSVAEIARAQGARIVFDKLEGDMSGFLYRDASQTVIGVNTIHAKTRQNFTIAHEIGHLMLHEQEQMHVDHEFQVRLRDNVSSKGTEDAEREANLFAASLLMPKEFLATLHFP